MSGSDRRHPLGGRGRKRFALSRPVLLPFIATALARPVLFLFGAAALAGCAALILPRCAELPDWSLREIPSSIVVKDRSGVFLGERPGGDGPFRNRISLAEIDPLLVRAALAAEDRRFFRHPGIDPLALARAVWRGPFRGRPLRGASTLTMQAVRVTRGQPRGFAGRLQEIYWSMVLEARLTKEQILEIYLNRAPYGPRLQGVAAASRRLFGKPPAVLSPSEAALLAVLPRAPSRYDPHRFPTTAIRARNRLLHRMRDLGWLEPDAAERAEASALALAPAPPRRTPHFIDWAIALADSIGAAPSEIRTSIDLRIQAEAERALLDRSRLLAGRCSGGAVVVLDTETAAIRSMVGSISYDSPEAGQVNAALAPRQPGSAVKPFTYAAAFTGPIRPSTILGDVPTSYEDATGIFAPRNYAGGFSGPVSARLSLANSWNVPAVEAFGLAGSENVARHFVDVGLARAEEIDRLGLGLTLGAGEVSLLDLAAAYATLARGGTWIEPAAILSTRDRSGRERLAPSPRRRHAIDPIACSWVSEILSDPAARAAAFGRGGPLEMSREVAAKTGTSSDWRDAWAVLYTARHTVAVWMGNPDGTATDRVTGTEGPALVARSILEALEAAEPSPPFPIPDGVEKRAVCPLSGCGAGSDCPHADWSPFRRADPPLPICAAHAGYRVDASTGLLARSCTPRSRVRRAVFAVLPERFSFWQEDRGLPRPPEKATPCLCGSGTCRALDGPQRDGGREEILFAIRRPVDGAVIAADRTLPADQQQLALEAEAPARSRVIWRIDGEAHGATRGVHRLFWQIRPGPHTIQASIPERGLRAECEIVVLDAGDGYPADSLGFAARELTLRSSNPPPAPPRAPPAPARGP